MKMIPRYGIRAALVVGGLVCMAMGARALSGWDRVAAPVNPLGINRSPYGEIFAMAMQGPIDTFWHQGQLAKSDPLSQSRPSACPSCGSHHPCAHDAAGSASDHGAPRMRWNDRLRALLERLEAASTERTNHHRPSTALDFHIRRQVENKLRFAYRLDPSHYGNYNSYHFFLTEPQVGTRPILTPAAARLAQETIDYCLAEPHDPRPALTAAAAATNVIHLMFADQHNPNTRYTTREMRDCLKLADQCIARHSALHARWLERGGDQLLSPMRVQEMEERYRFVKRIRDAAEVAIGHFERKAKAAGSSG